MLQPNTTAKMVTYIAGMQHQPMAKQHISNLPRDNPLELRRELTNKFDRNAVAVYHGPIKLGYVPAVDAPMVAAVMDAGRTATAVLSRASATSEITICWDAGSPPNVD